MKQYRNFFIFFLLCIIVILSSIGCKKSPTKISKEGFYFDTIISITLYDESYEYAIDHCLLMAKEYEALFSRTKENSDIFRINQNAPNPTAVSKDTIDLLSIALTYAKTSQGLFDPSIGALCAQWDAWYLDPEHHNYSTYPLSPKDQEYLATLTEDVDYRQIQLSGEKVCIDKDQTSAKLDLGGIAKGYIADQMKEYLLSEGITSGFINLGGNVLTLGKKTDGSDYTIGIQKPFSEDGTAALTVSVSDASVVTSGTYQRYFKAKDETLLHHMIDPRTGYPCQNELDSVTIICKKSVDADALSTTCFLMGEKDAMAYIESLPETEAIWIKKDGTITLSSGMGDTISYEILD